MISAEIYRPRSSVSRNPYDGAAVATRTYNQNMRLYQTTFGSGRVEFRGYRADSLIDSTNTPGVSFYVYSYDNNKNKVTEITNGSRRDEFTYDHEERLGTYRSNYQLTIARTGRFRRSAIETYSRRKA